MNRIFLFFILWLFAKSAIVMPECQHDNQEMRKHYEKLFQQYKEILKTNGQSRMNQEEGHPRPLRITFNDWHLNKWDSHTINYIMKLMETASEFFGKLIRVNPIQGKNIVPEGYGRSCLGFQFPESDKMRGVSNSDLHIYLVAKNKAQSQFGYSGFCVFDDKYLRPTFGLIEVNLNRIHPGSNEDFRHHLFTVMHEIIHILGFSMPARPFWINRKTKEHLNEKDIQTTKEYMGHLTSILETNQVKKTASKYFNCTKLTGMQMENEQRNLKFSSHWERTILKGEIMNAGGGTIFSIFTVALLKDTGFYSNINENLVTDIYFGSQKGCDFFENACKSNKQYREFSYIPKRGKKDVGLTFEYDAIGSSRQSYSECLIYTGQNMFQCQNESLADYKYNIVLQKGMNTFSYKSRSYISNVHKLYSSLQFSDIGRCFETECSNDNQFVFINISSEIQVICEKPAIIKDVFQRDHFTGKQEKIGTLTCPSDFQVMCRFKPGCPKSCSQEGFCVNGLCHCNKGYAGIDCSIKCNGVVSRTRRDDSVGEYICVQTCRRGMYKNPNNVCRYSCPRGYYGKEGRCQECHFSCSHCAGPRLNQCTSCQFLTYLWQKKCVRSCSSFGLIADEKKKRCIKKA